MEEINWIASRKYRLKPRDIVNAPFTDICVAISMPRELSKIEIPIDSPMARYGCTVQYGKETNRRIVVGRDPLEAIFHGILAIEQYLILNSRTQDIENSYGHSFDEKIEGFLWGPIACEYRKTGDSP